MPAVRERPGPEGPQGPAGPGNVLAGAAVPVFASPADDGAGMTWQAGGWAKVSLATSADLGVHAALTTSAHGGIVSATDPRLSDARTPAGAAGGDLAGGYPSPTVARLGGVALGSYVNPNNVALAPGAAGRNTVQPSGVGYAAFVLKQGVGGAADLMQCQSSGASVLAKVDGSGNIFSVGFGDAANAVAFVSTNTDATHGWVLTSKTSAKVPFTVKAAAAQAQNLTEWQDSNGTMLGNVSAGGAPRFSQAVIGPTSTGVGAGVHLLTLASAAGNVPLVARAAAAQTASRQEWQDNTGVAQLTVNAAGQLGFIPTTAPSTPTTGCLIYYASDGLHMKSSLGNDRLIGAA